jgi:hypothetical protein
MIEVSKLHDYAAKVLGASGRNFQELAISAVNDVSRDLRSRTVMDVATSGDDGESVAALSDTITLDQKYLTVYKRGLLFYMGLSGGWGREPDENAERYYRMALGEAQRLALVEEDGDVGFVR